MSDTGQDSSQERRHCRLHRQAAAAGDGKRVEQFDDHLVVVTAGRSEQETHDAATEADHTVQLVTKVLHGLAATDAIVGAADKITALFASFVAHAGHRS